MAAHQAPLSLGFSRQEYWTGLPFPSLMHENEKWKWSCSVVSNSLRPHGLQPTRLLHPWDFPVKNTGVGCHSLLQGIFLSQEIEPGSPTLQADSLLSEPPICIIGSFMKHLLHLRHCFVVVTIHSHSVQGTWRTFTVELLLLLFFSCCGS